MEMPLGNTDKFDCSSGAALGLYQIFKSHVVLLKAIVVASVLAACATPGPEECITAVGDQEFSSCDRVPFPGCRLPTSDKVYVCRSNPSPGCKSANGEGLSADTAFRWFRRVAGAELAIVSQLEGNAAPEAYEGSWENVVLTAIRGALEYGENGDRYVRYVLNEWEKAGLPELEGLPENWEQMGKKCAEPHRDQLRYPYPDYYYRMEELGWPQTQTDHEQQ